MARKTANTYLKEFKDLSEKLKGCEARIRNRLVTLIKKHPDAPIEYRDAEMTIIKASTINNEYYLNSLDIYKTIKYIEVIEAYLKTLEPVKQGNLFDKDSN